MSNIIYFDKEQMTREGGATEIKTEIRIPNKTPTPWPQTTQRDELVTLNTYQLTKQVRNTPGTKYTGDNITTTRTDSHSEGKPEQRLYRASLTSYLIPLWILNQVLRLEGLTRHRWWWGINSLSHDPQLTSVCCRRGARGCHIPPSPF